jgi:hypothetical protein
MATIGIGAVNRPLTVSVTGAALFCFSLIGRREDAVVYRASLPN